MLLAAFHRADGMEPRSAMRMVAMKVIGAEDCLLQVDLGPSARLGQVVLSGFRVNGHSRLKSLIFVNLGVLYRGVWPIGAGGW